VAIVCSFILSRFLFLLAASAFVELDGGGGGGRELPISPENDIALLQEEFAFFREAYVVSFVLSP